ncbi:MAG: hypothetical protein EXS10_00570 [Phycisphaerales bacterium]|nr:hypothetical protein [Phycisphaerales bacterium]
MPDASVDIRWTRTLRTQSSERMLGSIGGRDAIAVDIHHLANGQVVGTVIVLNDAPIDDVALPEILRRFDEDFLPGVEIENGGVLFSVVRGQFLANFESGV